MIFIRILLAIFFLLLPLTSLQSQETPPPYSEGEQGRELPAWIEEREVAPSRDFTGEFLKMLSLLATLLAVLILVTWAVRKLFSHKILKDNETSGIKVLERRMIGTKSVIYLLETKGRHFLVAETPQGVSLLGRWQGNSDVEGVE